MGQRPRDRSQNSAAVRHHLAGSQSWWQQGYSRRPPCRARWRPLRGASVDRARRADVSRLACGHGAVAPALQRARSPRAGRGFPRPAASGLFRQFVPSDDAPSGADLRPPEGRTGRRRAALGLPWHLLRVHQPAGAQVRTASASRHCRASRRWHEHVRHAGRAQRRNHDGLWRSLRPAHGDALGRCAAGSALLSAAQQTVRRRIAGEDAVRPRGPARLIRYQRRHAGVAGEHGSAGGRGGRVFHIRNDEVCRRVRFRARWAGRFRIHRRHWRALRRGPCGAVRQAGVARREVGQAGQRVQRAPNFYCGQSGLRLGHPHERGTDDRAAHAGGRSRPRAAV